MAAKISIHVDGYYGLVEGVPRLLKLFHKLNLSATFYVNLGREPSIFEIFKYRKNKSLSRTKKVMKRYTKLQLIKMIFLRRKIGQGHFELLRKIKKSGHEVQPHCWNHLEWSKNFNNFNYKMQIENMVKVFRDCFGYSPTKFAPPTWKINDEILLELKKAGFKEVTILKENLKNLNSLPEMNLEILTFEKTPEELLSEGLSAEEIKRIYEKELKKNKSHVYFHADFEGRQGLMLLEKILS